MIEKRRLATIIVVFGLLILVLVNIQQIERLNKKDVISSLVQSFQNKLDESYHCENKNIFDLVENDTCLVADIKNNWLHKRLNPLGNYRFAADPPDKLGHLRGQAGQAELVDRILGQKTGGFFIECGAAEGEVYSNTLFFELKRNWTGLLVEPNREEFGILYKKNRKAMHINACLSDSGKPKKVLFNNNIKNMHEGGMVSAVGKGQADQTTEEICLPLNSILLALGNPRVDYLSLDVEGAEIDVLRSISWSKIDIKIISIEVNKIDTSVLRRILEKNGYSFYKELYEGPKVLDHVFVHESLIPIPPPNLVGKKH